MKINHVAIAVENVEDATKVYQDALDIRVLNLKLWNLKVLKLQYFI